MSILSEKDERRFWSKVKKGAQNECWLWIGDFRPTGYGRMKVSGQGAYAHRLSLMLATGEQPEGRLALHSCDNRACVNPSHLRWGTVSDNTLDALQRNHVWRENLIKRLRDNYHNIKYATRRIWEPAEDYMLLLANSGYSHSDLAKWYKITNSGVYHALKRAKRRALDPQQVINESVK